MSELLKLAASDSFVEDILKDQDLNHQEATDELNRLFSHVSRYDGFRTSRTTVRRAREKMNVVSSHYNSGQGRYRGSDDLAQPSLHVPPSPKPDYSMWPKGKPAVVAVIGDYQIGAHDRDFIEKQCQVIRDLDPDIIISTGDELDSTSLGSWVHGLPGQYGRTMHQEREAWVDEIAPMINEAAPGAQKRMCDSNHIRRLPVAIEKYLPGLRDAPELFVKNFLHLDELGWAFDEGPTEFLPGIVYSHGDDVHMTSRTQASKSREVIKTRQRNYVFGHTHQASLNTTALGYGFNMETKWSLNPGNGMAIREASYVKSTSPDWSRGIGVIYYDGEESYPELHLEIGGKIRFNGRSY